MRRKKCRTKIIIAFNISENKNYFIREPILDDHDYVPNKKSVNQRSPNSSLKRKAEEQPRLTAAQILRTKVFEKKVQVYRFSSKIPFRKFIREFRFGKKLFGREGFI